MWYIFFVYNSNCHGDKNMTYAQFFMKFKINFLNLVIMKFLIPSSTNSKKLTFKIYKVRNLDSNWFMILLITNKIKYCKRTSSMINFSPIAITKEKFSKTFHPQNMEKAKNTQPIFLILIDLDSWMLVIEKNRIGNFFKFHKK